MQLFHILPISLFRGVIITGMSQYYELSQYSTSVGLRFELKFVLACRIDMNTTG